MYENWAYERIEVVYMGKLNAKEYKSFEDIKHISENASEFWYARELAAVLQYANWQNFTKAVDRAVLACKNSGCTVTDHFIEISKMVEIGK